MKKTNYLNLKVAPNKRKLQQLKKKNKNFDIFTNILSLIVIKIEKTRKCKKVAPQDNNNEILKILK